MYWKLFRAIIRPRARLVSSNKNEDQLVSGKELVSQVCERRRYLQAPPLTATVAAAAISSGPTTPDIPRT